MMPLIFASQDEENVVKKVGGAPEVKKHMEDLGFVAGSNVKVIAMVNGDSVIVQVKEARIAISGEMARKIYI